MGRHPDVVQVLEEELRNPVIEDTLALDHLVLLGVERGRIILEVLDQGTRLRALIQNLRLAFVNATPTAHWDVPCVVEVHGFGVAPLMNTTRDGAAAKGLELMETKRELAFPAT